MSEPLTPYPGTVLWSVHARGAEWTAIVRLYPGSQPLLILSNGAEFSSQMFQDGAALLERAEAVRRDLRKLAEAGKPPLR